MVHLVSIDEALEVTLLLDSKKLHTIASVLLARRAKNNLNSPRGRFSSDKFSRDEEARLET